jgi:hypothetical protein
MLFMFLWIPVVDHNNSWNIGSDMWGIFRGAHYVGWGFIGGVYTPSNGISSFPGMSVLLAPVAMLSGKLHLTESFPPFVLAHPTAGLILQPIELLLASTVVFASDALAERLSVPERRRIALCFVVAVVAWPTAAVWDHAEDVLAMTFTIYAMIAMFDRKWSKCGWLFGFGIVMQPLVLLLLPLLVGATPRRRRVLLALRSMALSVTLVGVAWLGNAADTFQAVVRQPSYPAHNHSTPWLALTPKFWMQSGRNTEIVPFITSSGREAVRTVAVSIHRTEVVTGGVGRTVDLVLALLIGLYAWRRPHNPVRLLWLAAIVLASRCFFEVVMCPYYLAPPLILALVVCSRTNRARFSCSVVIASAISAYAYFYMSPWAWWLPIVAGLTAVLVLGYSNDASNRSRSHDVSDVELLSIDDAADESDQKRDLEPAL